MLDRVKFPLGTTWITRNRFKNDQGAFWLSVPVWKKHLELQRLDRVRICYEGRYPLKLLRSLDHTYANEPYFEEHRQFLEKFLVSRWNTLIDLNLEATGCRFN